VHGFRFTARAVFRSLLTRYEGAAERGGSETLALPRATSKPMAAQFDQLLAVRRRCRPVCLSNLL
jgi:hypothetical protein